MEWNQIDENCAHLFGNFTTCLSAVYMDIQNTLHIHFRVNNDFLNKPLKMKYIIYLFVNKNESDNVD